MRRFSLAVVVLTAGVLLAIAAASAQTTPPPTTGGTTPPPTTGGTTPPPTTGGTTPPPTTGGTTTGGTTTRGTTTRRNGNGGNGGADTVRLPKKVSKNGIRPARLGKTRKQLRRDVGEPSVDRSRFMSYRTRPGGGLLIGFDLSESGFVGTGAKKPRLDGVRVGDKARKARRRLKGERKRGKLLVDEEKDRAFVVGLRKNRVDVVGVAEDTLSNKDLKKFVKKSG